MKIPFSRKVGGFGTARVNQQICTAAGMVAYTHVEDSALIYRKIICTNSACSCSKQRVVGNFINYGFLLLAGIDVWLVPSAQATKLFPVSDQK